MTDRRSFLSGLLTLSVIPLLPSIALAKPLPIIWGDMDHDDSLGLSALLSGEPFEVEGEGFIAVEGHLSGGVFLLESPLHVKGNHVFVRDVSFFVAPDINQWAYIEGNYNTFMNIVVTYL